MLARTDPGNRFSAANPRTERQMRSESLARILALWSLDDVKEPVKPVQPPSLLAGNLFQHPCFLLAVLECFY